MSRSHWIQVVTSLVIVGVAGAAVVWMIASAPVPTASEQGPMGTLVRTVKLDTVRKRMPIHGSGSVRPAAEVTLQPEVSGRIVSVHPDLEPGGQVTEGDVLVQLDRRDYELAVREARARLAQAEAELAIEQGRQRVARQEWELFADEIPEEERNPSLALREPQLESARANVEAARTAIDRAELDLERTAIRAPFDALVVSENAAIGKLATTQTEIAELVGTDEAWVEAAVVADRLPYIDVGADGRGALASVRYDAGGLVTWRVGRVSRVLGDLDPEGRMARLLVSVPDPLQPSAADRAAARGLASEPSEPSFPGGAAASRAELPLLLNAWVEVEIRGNQQLVGVELPREYLRGDDDVWVYDDGQLAVREVEIAFETPDSVFVTAGLSEDDRIVTTQVSAPVAGMPLRLADGGAEGRRESDSDESRGARPSREHDSRQSRGEREEDIPRFQSIARPGMRSAWERLRAEAESGTEGDGEVPHFQSVARPHMRSAWERLTADAR